MGDLAELYLFVGQTESHVGFVQIAPENRYQMAGLLEPGGRTVLESEDISPIAPVLYPSTEPLPQVDSIIENGEETSIGTPSLAQGQLTVTGHWAFIDRNDNYTSALEFIVQIIRGDNGNHLAWCYTSHNGTYSCGPFTNPGSAGVRSVLRTWTNYNPYGDILTIINPDWGTSTNINNTYGVQTGVTVFPDGVHDIGAWFVINGSTYERAYWTQYDLNRTWRYIWFGTGLSQNPRETSGPATVRWKIDSTDGTYYSYGGHIHLTGADPLSNTIVGHEYAHNVQYTIYGDTLPPTPNCNPHNIQLASSAGCAWVEGWANFLPLAVNNEPIFRWPSGATLNLENPTWGTAGWHQGDTVEGRVAGSLWDILDANNEGDDQYTDNSGIVDIWDTIYHQNDDNFSQYWSAWRSRGHENGSAGPIMSIFQNTINYRNGPSNDDFANANMINSIPVTVSNLSTSAATTQGNDPTTPCGSSSSPKQSRSVWYRYTPSVTRNFNINTNGSSYDTVLAVWSGAFGSLTNRGCNDDGGTGLNSSLDITLFAGTTYHIEVMSYGSGSGGLLNLRISQDNTMPNGSISLNGGHTYAAFPTINLNFSAMAAGNGVAEMRFRNEDSSWSAWETYTNNKSWTLSSNDGHKTVYAQFRDFVGNVSPISSSNIILERVMNIPLSVDPQLDGHCNEAQYANALTRQLKPYSNGSSATIKLVRSTDYLWVCFSELQAGTGSQIPFAGIRVDVNNSADQWAQSDDYGFFIKENGVLQVVKGNGSGEFSSPEPLESLQAQISTNNNIWSAELRIDAEILGGWYHLARLDLGHYWVHSQGNDYHWPTASYNKPYTWAETAFGYQTFIPLLQNK